MRILGRSLRFVSVLSLGGLVVGVWAGGYFSQENLNDASLMSVSAVIAQIAATMIGFLLAALAILASIAGMRLLRNMQRTGHYLILLSRLFISAIFFFLLMLVGGTSMFIGWNTPFVIELMFGLILASCASLVQAAWDLARVLMSLGPSDQTLE